MSPMAGGPHQWEKTFGTRGIGYGGGRKGRDPGREDMGKRAGHASITSVESKDFPLSMRQLRDLVSQHPLQPFLMDDLESWSRLCDAMDSLEDHQGESSSEAETQREALNAIRSELDMEESDWTDIDNLEAHRAAIQASLEATTTELGDRANAHYQRFDREPVTSFLDKTDYPVSKVASLIQKGQQAQSPGWELVNLNVLRDQLKTVRQSLLERRLEQQHHLADIDDALFVLNVLEQSSSTSSSDDRGRELDLLARIALPKLVARVKELARDIDDAYRERRSGWDLN